MRILCTGCGQPIADGLTRPNDLCFCTIACAKRAGQPDSVLARLRQLEEQAGATK